MDVVDAKASDQIKENVELDVALYRVTDDVAEIWLLEELAETHKDITCAGGLGFNITGELSIRRNRHYNKDFLLDRMLLTS